MAHMEPEIVYGQWILVDGPAGTEHIEADLVGQVEEYPKPGQPGTGDEPGGERQPIPIPDELQAYVENTTAWEIKVVSGWGARLSAPGYLDATPWTVFETEEEARAYLADEQADE